MKSYIIMAIGVLCVVPPIVRGDGPDAGELRRLRRDVDERERQLIRAQRDLAEAQARLALAEGKRDAAIAELRKAVVCFERNVQWIRDHANWYCDPREPMEEAQFGLATTRARLAEVVGDAAALVAARKTLVGFHEKRVERIRRLEQMGAVRPEEVQPEQDALTKAQERLSAAEKRLSNARAAEHENPE